MTLRDEKGIVKGNPKHALSFDQALYAMTQEAANLSGWGDQLGSISAGKWADFVVLDRPLPEPVDQRLLNMNVEATYIAGHAVYHKATEKTTNSRR